MSDPDRRVQFKRHEELATILIDELCNSQRFMDALTYHTTDALGLPIGTTLGGDESDAHELLTNQESPHHVTEDDPQYKEWWDTNCDLLRMALAQAIVNNTSDALYTNKDEETK